MQRFRFRLQRVLDWQQRACHLEQEKLKRCLADVAETEEKLAQLDTRSIVIEQEFAQSRTIVPADLKALAEFRRKTAGDRNALGRERERQLGLLSAQRETFVSENRRLQMLEKLRERALEQHTLAADRELEALSLESYLSTWVSGKVQ
jgi:flagellar export protein FliJ